MQRGSLNGVSQWRGSRVVTSNSTTSSSSNHTGDEPHLTTEETKKHYHKGCPGCQLEEANQIRTDIPYLNFFFIWIIALTSTLPIQSLFPFLYFMIRDMNIAKREEDISFYAGFVGSSYFFARALSSVPWGVFADKYGRKPCIVISILSVIVFNTLFGLSTRYWMAIVTRGLLGMLCGILGLIKAYATEVCRKEHKALAMSLVTSSRAIAFVVGPSIGGFLAQPAEKYPHIFSKESIFGRFPYFLPCFTISILAMGSCIATIWLPETLHFHNDGKVGGADEEEAQISKELEAQVGLSNIEPRNSKVSSDTSLKNLLKNWQFMSSVILYCIFSLHDVAYQESFALWAESKRKFRGLSWTTQDVGIVLAISGIGVLVYQFVVYPFIVKYFGPIRPLRPAVILAILLLTAYPFMDNLQGLELRALISIASTFKNIFSATITTACNILQNTAVTQKERGAANGISVTLMSLFKAVAPAAAGFLVSWTQKHVTGLFLRGDQILFLVISMVAVIGLILTFKPFFSMSNALRHL